MKINIFRSLLVSSLVVSATFFSSCDEDTGIEIKIPQTQEALYTIEPLSSTSLSKVDTLQSNLDSMLAANDASREDITVIELQALTLSLTDKNGVLNASQNFNNIKSIGINIAELTGSFTAIQGIDSATMASTFNNMNPIVFPPYSQTVNLLPFVAEPSFRVQLDGRIYNSTVDTMYIKSIMTFQIGVTL
jgi:hypothetical protein